MRAAAVTEVLTHHGNLKLMLSQIQHTASLFLLEARSSLSGLRNHFIVGASEAVNEEADTTAAGAASEKSQFLMQMLLIL